MSDTDTPPRDDDTAEAYQQYLAHLINNPHPKMSTRHWGRHVNRCREQAAARYPIGSKAAKSGDFGWLVLVAFVAMLAWLLPKLLR